MELGLTDATPTINTVTLHHLDCRSFLRTSSKNKSGPYRNIQEARGVGREHPHDPCILICRICRPLRGTRFEDWRCLCFPQG